MNEPRLQQPTLPHLPAPEAGRQPLGGALRDLGYLATPDLLEALGRSWATGAPLDRVLLCHGGVTAEQILQAEGRRHGAATLDGRARPSDPAVAGLIAPETCLRLGAMPWSRSGDTLTIAATSPAAYRAMTAEPVLRGLRTALALVTEGDLEAEIAARQGPRLARLAERSVPDDESCRDLNLASPRRRAAAAGLSAACAGLILLSPSAFFAAVAVAALAALLLSEGLKLAAALAAPRGYSEPPEHASPRHRPTVTLLLPLHREERIIAQLLGRLERLSYPKPLLDVILVLEADDRTTAEALAALNLPPWARVLTVPGGPVTTKPRALNYALRFARGSIVGVLDAEDAPAANQIDRVVGAFHAAPPDVACLQGILDFYNPHANWLSRCFAIEYATWFRLILPGLCRLGFAIPLGGTTVYFRRAALEAVSGWDAHNVTEDADLGLRLARHGYRTEILRTVTREEANNRPWPWIRQRSRWIKGFMLTWAAHSRAPLRLWRELGAWRTAGMQVLFVTAWLQFLLAPILWLYWLVPLGWGPPAPGLLPTGLVVGLFLAAQAVAIAVAAMAVARAPHRGLLPWVPTILFYFPLGVVAAYKALWEVATAPFYWDKTAHGTSPPDHDRADIAEA